MLDTSNGYGPSAFNYGRAFRSLNLIPGQAGYDAKLRQSIWLTSKTAIRWANNPKPTQNPSNGPAGSFAVDDLKRSLTLIFGDGEASYPASEQCASDRRREEHGRDWHEGVRAGELLRSECECLAFAGHHVSSGRLRSDAEPFAGGVCRVDPWESTWPSWGSGTSTTTRNGAG